MKTPLSKIEGNPFWEFSQNVHDLCRPLFSQFRINYFEYTQFYADNTCASFTSEQEYVKFYLNHTQFESTYKGIPTGKYLWGSYIDANFLEQINLHYNHYHGITYINEHAKYTELFNFAAPKTNQNAINLFLNYEEAFDYFILFFLKIVTPFIKRNFESRIILPETFGRNNITTNEEKSKITTEFIHQLNNSSSANKNAHFLKINQHPTFFTRREIQCLSILVEGATSKEMARTLNLSPRTIETFCANIMVKTGLPSRIELLGKMNNSTLNLLKILAELQSLLAIGFSLCFQKSTH